MIPFSPEQRAVPCLSRMQRLWRPFPHGVCNVAGWIRPAHLPLHDIAALRKTFLSLSKEHEQHENALYATEI